MTTTGPVISQLLAGVTARDVDPDPFPHVVVRGALDDELADALLAEYPPVERVTGGAASDGNERFDLPAARILTDAEDSPIWQDFARSHTSNEFARRLFDIFGDHLPPAIVETTRGPDRPRSGIRGLDDPATVDVLLDAQISVNTPVVAWSKVKGPHVDRPIALMAGLYYLRRPGDTSNGGDLELYRPANRHSLSRFDHQHVADDEVELVKTVAYEHNTLVVFVNSIRSLHGVTMREPTDEPRRLVNLVCQVREPFFDLGSHQADRARWAREHPWETAARAPLSRRVAGRVRRSVRRARA